MFEDIHVSVLTMEGAVYEGKVLLMEEGVGCSIVNPEDNTDYIMCIRGPLCEQWKENRDAGRFEYFKREESDFINAFEEIMKYIEECIQFKKVIKEEVTNKIELKHIPNPPVNIYPTEETCAFH